MKRNTGRFTPPVSAVTVILLLAPTLTVATANAALPFGPGMFTMPSLVGVAASATISGTSTDEAVSRSVLTPTNSPAGSVFDPTKLNATSVGGKVSVGSLTITYVWACPGPIVTAVFGVPVT